MLLAFYQYIKRDGPVVSMLALLRRVDRFLREREGGLTENNGVPLSIQSTPVVTANGYPASTGVNDFIDRILYNLRRCGFYWVESIARRDFIAMRARLPNRQYLDLYALNEVYTRPGDSGCNVANRHIDLGDGVGLPVLAFQNESAVCFTNSGGRWDNMAFSDFFQKLLMYYFKADNVQCVHFNAPDTAFGNHCFCYIVPLDPPITLQVIQCVDPVNSSVSWALAQVHHGEETPIPGHS